MWGDGDSMFGREGGEAEVLQEAEVGVGGHSNQIESGCREVDGEHEWATWIEGSRG